MSLWKRIKAAPKNRAIRMGQVEAEEDFDTVASALETAKKLPDAIRGKEVGKDYRDDYDSHDLVGPGSQNIPLLSAANDYWYWHHRNLPKAHDVLDAWERYSYLHFMTSETYSPFVYGYWIIGSILTVAFGARKLQRYDVADRLYGIVRTAYALWALGCSGDDWSGNHPGKAVTWAGSRGWVTVKDRYGGDYYDDNGVLNQPDNIDWCFATNFLAAALEWKAPVKWLKDLVMAMASVYADDPWGITAIERAALREVGLARYTLPEQAFKDVIAMLEAAPVKPAIPCRIIQTDRFTGFVANQSISPGSTSFLYGRFWFPAGRPPGRWWDGIWPGVDDRAGWLNFDPSVRESGVSGYCHVAIEPGTGEYLFTGERTSPKSYTAVLDDEGAEIEPHDTIPANTYYFELDGGHRKADSYRDGPRVLVLPYLQRVYDVSWGPSGVEVHYPEPGNGGGNGGGNGDDDCDEGNWLQRLICVILRFLRELF